MAASLVRVGAQQSSQTPAPFTFQTIRARVCPKRVSRTTTHAANNDRGSNDPVNSTGSEEGDVQEDSTESLTRELRAYVSEETHDTNRRHLDLLFEVSASALTKNKKVSAAAKTACGECGGSGEIECPYCHGTGALTVGDVLFCDHTGCKKCVVCRNGSGLVQCTKCRGCGSYANWMNR